MLWNGYGGANMFNASVKDPSLNLRVLKKTRAPEKINECQKPNCKNFQTTVCL